MKAAVYKGKHRFSVDDIPIPCPGPGEVLVKVRYSAICGTDVHEYLYDATPVGAVLGHEYSGTVDQIGQGVTLWKKGDRVMGGGGEPPPGINYALRQHPRYNFREMAVSQNSMRSYAEYVINKDWQIMSIPEGVTDQQAALCEPAAVAVRAVRKSALKPGDKVAVLGAGPIGLFCIQVAKAAGATEVYVSEPSSARAQAAIEIGANAVVDPTADDPVTKIVEYTNGIGPEIVFECASAKSTLSQAFNMAKREGQVVLVALAWEPTSITPIEWMGREITLVSSFGTSHSDWSIALDLIQAGKIDMQPMITDSSFIKLEHVQEAFEALVKPSSQLQMIIEP